MAHSNTLMGLGIVALALCANVSRGAPLSHGSDALAKANTLIKNLAEPVHGTHRACVRGWVHLAGGSCGGIAMSASPTCPFVVEV